MSKHLNVEPQIVKPYVDDYPPYLLAQIPPLRPYVARQVSEDHTDLDILRDAWENQEAVIAYGPTGTGKTSAVYHLAAQLGIPVILVPCAQITHPEALLGRHVPGSNGQLRWVDGGVLLAGEYPVFVVLDEANMLKDSLSTALNGALDFRRTITLEEHPFTHHCRTHGAALIGEDHEAGCDVVEWRGPFVKKLHERSMFVASYNPGYRGGRPLNEAFEGRWVQLEYGYSSQIEKQILRSGVLVDIAEKLRGQADTGLLRTPIPTSALIKFEDHVDRLGYETARDLFFYRFKPEERSIVETTWQDAWEADLMKDYGYVWQEVGS